MVIGITRARAIVGGTLLSVLFCGTALGQATCEAYGTVKDREDNPLEGVVVTFRPRGNPSMTYSATTNKKGRYFATGLFTPKEADKWEILVEAAGYVPVKVVIESRTVHKVLVGDILESELPLGAKIPEIAIRPLGSARVDLTLAPESELAQPVPAGRPDEPELPAAAAAPRDSDAWNEALTLAQAGELEAAVRHFEKAIAASPDDADRAATFAKVLYGLERYAEAEVQAQRAIGIAPALADAHRVLASAQIERGRLDAARATLAAAIAAVPGDIELRERLAFVAGELDDSPGQIAAYEGITTIDPANVNAWMALGGLHAAAGDPQRSEQAYQKVAELDPADAYQTFYNLGVLTMNRRDRSEADTRRAIDAFRKALEIKPDYGLAYQQLGYALLGVGDRQGAVEALETYVRVSPSAADVARVRGMIETLKKH